VSLEKMMFIDELYLSFMLMLFFRLTSTQAIKLSPNNTDTDSPSASNMTSNGNVTLSATSMKNQLDKSKNIIHDAFAKMDRGTLIRGTIVLAGIACLVLMYIVVKAFL
jgi:hypothetical protein